MTLCPNLPLNGYRCAGILSKMPFSRTAVPESRQKRAQYSVLDKRNSGLLFWQYTLVKKQRKLRQSAFRIAPQQAQANLCEPSDLARNDVVADVIPDLIGHLRNRRSGQGPPAYIKTNQITLRLPVTPLSLGLQQLLPDGSRYRNRSSRMYKLSQ